MARRSPASRVPAPGPIVVKIGSALLASAGELDETAVGRVVADVAAVRRTGRPVVIVSSGAVAAGFRELGLKDPPTTIVEKQAAAAVGQQRLVRAYARAFARRRVQVAQVLLTSDDVEDRSRFLNARHTLGALLDHDVVPIVNENDSVSFDELKVGDNDRLSALVAGLIDARLLVILSTVNGVYAGGRKGRIIEIIEDAKAAAAHVSSERSTVGVGGMGTKIEAAGIAARTGTPAVIANGRQENIVQRLVEGETIGTWFPAATMSPRARKRWIGFSARTRGRLTIDAGAIRAITENGASLLPSGITSVDGVFDIGAPVEILGPCGTPHARGLVSYGSAEIERIMGHRTTEIASVLGYAYCDEVIHRDDLSLT